jgi:hypothetical protein
VLRLGLQLGLANRARGPSVFGISFRVKVIFKIRFGLGLRVGLGLGLAQGLSLG